MKKSPLYLIVAATLLLTGSAHAFEAEDAAFTVKKRKAGSCDGIEVTRNSTPEACAAENGRFAPAGSYCVDEQQDRTPGPCCCTGG